MDTEQQQPETTDKTSPRPWLAIYARVLDAGGKTVCVCEKDSMHGMADDETAKADASLVVDAVNNADSWRDAYIKARTERNAFLLERDRLRDALNEVCHRVSVALNCPRHETEAIDLLVHDLLGIKECARAAIGEGAEIGTSRTGKGETK